MQRQSSPNNVKPVSRTLATFPSLIRQEGTKGCKSIASLDILGITPGKTVADIGAGSGWFTVRAAKRVRDTGTVYAVDINPEAIRYIESRIRKENLRNVKPILGRPDNPLLPGTVDAVLLLKTYHEVAQPITLLRNLRASLSPARTMALPGTS